MPRTPEQLRRTAFHESGHAVIGRVVGMICGGATIVPDYEAMTAGVAITHDHWVVGDAWECRGKFRGDDEVSVMRGRIITSMAGREAEIVALGERPDDGNGVGDEDDRYQIALMATEAGIEWSYVERLRSKARALVRRHWGKIEAVAAALLEHKTLEAEQIDAATTERERAIAARIALVRKPLRVRIAAPHHDKVRIDVRKGMAVRPIYGL
jgi:ATP-dependent Zn protease